MNKETVLQGLNVFWKGMLAIFIAIIIIMLAVYLLQKVSEATDNVIANRAATADEREAVKQAKRAEKEERKLARQAAKQAKKLQTPPDDTTNA
ncbi:MAG: hypothetical protein SO434_01405 [Eubacteriales bacterium]|nr:hypothetical protein [Eubacteriales bacterium]